MISRFACAVFVVAALVLGAVTAQGEPASPCPKLFHYDSVNDAGRWTGNLVLDSEDDLHGVWIRVIFDSPPKEVIVDGYEVIQSNGTSNEVVIKNSGVLLQAGSATNVKITVNYDDGKFPNVIGYRLNARVICPEGNTIGKNFFEGDYQAKYFLSAIKSKAKPIALKPPFECGLKRSDSYPWQAAVSLKKGGNDQYICEATLISPSHVILPAHCVTFNNDVDQLPEDILSVTLAGAQGKLGVKRITVHRGYDPDTLEHDIAVLELISSVTIDDSVRPICLDDTGSYTDTYVLVGKSVESDGSIGNEIADRIVEELEDRDCTERATDLIGSVGDNNFCVSYVAGSTKCVGNSGSNIITVQDDVAILKGIVIVGPVLQNKNNCNSGTTIIGVDINDYYNWILQTIS